MTPAKAEGRNARVSAPSGSSPVDDRSRAAAVDPAEDGDGRVRLVGVPAGAACRVFDSAGLLVYEHHADCERSLQRLLDATELHALRPAQVTERRTSDGGR